MFILSFFFQHCSCFYYACIFWWLSCWIAKHYGQALLNLLRPRHYIDVIMTTMASQITSLTIVYSTVYSDADHRKHQSSALLAFVRGIHRDRWIPRTKGQLRGKCFHLMTSSWALFDNMDWLSLQNGQKITCPMKCGVKYLIGCTVEVWEWISYSIPYFIMDVITYPCWDYVNPC